MRCWLIFVATRYRLLYADPAERAPLLTELLTGALSDQPPAGDRLFELLQQRSYGRGPHTSALTAVTAPVFGADAKPVLTLLLTFSPASVDVSAVEHYLRPLMQTCHRITTTIGGREPG